jgi:hypothetical protein
MATGGTAAHSANKGNVVLALIEGFDPDRVAPFSPI